MTINADADPTIAVFISYSHDSEARNKRVFD
jgi:hypothetical protein